MCSEFIVKNTSFFTCSGPGIPSHAAGQGQRSFASSLSQVRAGFPTCQLHLQPRASPKVPSACLVRGSLRSFLVHGLFSRKYETPGHILPKSFQVLSETPSAQ